MLGVDDIQGKKTGFLAGNNVYYMGGVVLVQELFENETVGLTHPFFHDLRSRGTGIASYDGVGKGNDFSGWEWWRETKIAYSDVIADGVRFEKPAPAHMYWSPDKMVVEYNLTTPYLHGAFGGWCENWQEGSSNGTGVDRSFWTNLTKDTCWAHCTADPACGQAVYEAGTDITSSQCWIGLNKMERPPTGSRSGCNPPSCYDYCFAPGKPVAPVVIREEKFISSNDVVSTIITADRPMTLEVSGHSFHGGDGAGQVVTLNGKCTVDKSNNAIRVLEGGTMKAEVAQGPDVLVDAVLMLDGMSGVLIASRPMANATVTTVSEGVCGYVFNISVDTKGTTISWTMDDDYDAALASVKVVQTDPAKHLVAKTTAMNSLLNDVVPFFNCSDADVVKVYYFLWSLYLMYFTQGDSGMQTRPHTQSAVNNFLGMHRYDAIFQILVGSWASPATHATYANGNVLSWASTLPYRKDDQLPDNFGIDWSSGCYGPETIAHVIGAWQIFEHSGNMTYLAQAYDFYKTLFWDGISGNHFGYAYDSVLCLNKMAAVLGKSEDAAHWNQTVGMDSFDDWLHSQWEVSTTNMFGDTSSGMQWMNIAPAGITHFPRNWTVAMAEHWMDNSASGFYGEVPLTCLARQDWPPPPVDPDSPTYNFMVTPDANWYMLRALYMHTVDGLANKFTLDHLKNYNMEWGIPVAPETRRMNYELHGDQYSNFNAGKILLILEGMGGIRYSIQDDTFTYADNLPVEWDFMEFHVPVQQKNGSDVTWVKARSSRVVDGGKVTKTVTVEANPFTNLHIQPWAEDATVTSSTPAGGVVDAPTGHVGWTFTADNATVELSLGGEVPATGAKAAAAKKVAAEVEAVARRPLVEQHASGRAQEVVEASKSEVA